MKKSALIARYGIIVALIICAYFIDSLISKPFPIRYAVTTIIVIMTVSQLFDFKTAVFSTTIFGLSSFIFAYLFPSASSYLFIQPQISILPRIFIGVVSFSVYLFMKKITANSDKQFLKDYVSSSVAAASGVLTNTVLVLFMISISNNNDFFTSFMATMVKFNFIAEFSAAIIVVPLVATAVKKRISKL